MTDRRFALAEHLLATKPWELFAMVEMGPDRMHHGFWKFMDPSTASTSRQPVRDAILDYHRHVDGLVGRLLEHADDETAVLVVSDHGAKRMDGGIRVNEWLRREGLLATSRPSRTARRSLGEVGVDWAATTAWGEGGYYARVFLNVQRPRAGGHGRAGGLRARARRPRAAARGDPRTTDGEPIGTRVFKPGGASTTR